MPPYVSAQTALAPNMPPHAGIEKALVQNTPYTRAQTTLTHNSTKLPKWSEGEQREHSLITSFFPQVTRDEWQRQEEEKLHKRKQDADDLRNEQHDTERMTVHMKLASSHKKNNVRKSRQWKRVHVSKINEGIQDDDRKKKKKQKVLTLRLVCSVTDGAS